MSSYRDTFEQQVHYLQSLGSRPTGSHSHAALIERVAIDLENMGLEVHRDRHTFERWAVTPERLALSVNGRRVTIASPWPYSGKTSPAGITAPLTVLTGWRKKWRSAAGHIVVIEVAHRSVPYHVLLDNWHNEAPINRKVSHPVISAALSRIDLRKAKAAGVLAVIAVWKGLSDRSAAGQYLPFTGPYEDLPAVWVAEGEGAAVLRAAREHASATLVLDATLTPDVPTDTVWAVSPGTLSGETVLVVTHSDGTNAVEENGHIGLLALAHDAATNPHDRTIVFIFVTGHLRIPAVTKHGQATTAWLEAHPELWSGQGGAKTAVAAIAIEHLGATERPVNSAIGTRGPAARPEPELLYATTRELAERVHQEWEGAEGRVVPAKPSALIHFGEGEPLFQHHIPAVALVSGPEYLLAEIRDSIVDVEILTRQVESFRRLLRYLSAAGTTRKQLGTVRTPSWVRRMVAAVCVLFVTVRDPGN